MKALLPTFRNQISAILLLGTAWLLQPTSSTAAEIEVDLTATPRIYTAEGSTCEATPAEGGSGVKMSYNFENSTGDWAHFTFAVPAIDSPVKKVTIIAKGSPAMTAFSVRGGKAGKPLSWPFGPPTEDDYQTFEIDPKDLAESPGKQKNSQLEYPITTVFFQIKAKDSRQGFLEVSKVTIETE